MDRWLVPAQVVIAQAIEPPKPGQELIWIAFLLALAVGFLGREMLKRIDADFKRQDSNAQEWKDQAKTLLPELAATRQSLTSMIGTVEKVHDTTSEVVEDVAALAQAVAELAQVVARIESRISAIENDPPDSQTRGRR